MIRRNHKDRLFVKLFGDPDNKENLLSLYNALNDRSYDDPNKLEINTIEDVIYMGRKAEVTGMILTDYDEEKTMEMFKREYRHDGYSEGRLEGEQIGRNLEKLNIAMNMKAKGMSDKEIADLLDITPERLKEILSADRVHEQE